MDALFQDASRRRRPSCSAAARTPTVGAFEGAMYEARGYYRPQADCVMFTRDEVPFCAVCRRALEKVIDLLQSDDHNRHDAKARWREGFT